MCQEIYIDTKSHSTVLCIQSEIAAASSVCLRHYIMMVYYYKYCDNDKVMVIQKYQAGSIGLVADISTSGLVLFSPTLMTRSILHLFTFIFFKFFKFAHYDDQVHFTFVYPYSSTF